MKMFTKKLRRFCRHNATERNYNNVVEASYWARVFRKLAGNIVIDGVSTPENKIESRFSVMGFICFIIWNGLFFYCSFKAHAEDQTILRALYDTRLGRYGDDFERITCVLYVIPMIFWTCFRAGWNVQLPQKFVNIDLFIAKSAHKINFNKIAVSIMSVTLFFVSIYTVRIISLWLILSPSIYLPFEKMFQVVYSDLISLLFAVVYSYVVLIFKERYILLNNCLREIHARHTRDDNDFVRKRTPDTESENFISFQEESRICENILICGKLYSMLYDLGNTMNKVCGLPLFFTIVRNSYYIILYCYYVMEVTSAGLFHDLPRYLEFLIYSVWQITIAGGIIYMIVAHCSIAVTEAKNTSYEIHKIINEDLSPDINNKAIQLSIQLLHQKLAFSVCGFYELDYVFLQQGSRQALTYLIILLQSVTGKK